MSAHNFTTEIETEILGELPAKIAFDYQPAEPAVMSPIEDAYPGCAEEFSVTSLEVVIAGVWIQVLGMVPEYYHDLLEEKCSEHFDELYGGGE